MPDLKLTPAQLVALRDTHQLTQNQLAQLARGRITAKSGRATGQSTIVQRWESGERNMPESIVELLQVKLLLLARGVATFEQLVDMSLADVLRHKWHRLRD